MTHDNSRTITYSSFDKATRIAKGNNTIDFIYGINRSHFERVDTQNGEKIIT